MATLAKMREKTAHRLGVFATGQQLRSEIDSDLTNAYTEVYATLETLGLATWSSTDAVPDQFVHPIVTWMAYVRLDEYAVPDNKYQRIVNDFQTAERDIRRMQSIPLQGTTEHENF